MLTSISILALTGMLSEVWAMINAMQILTYIIDYRLFIPANVQTAIGFLRKLSDFELFDMRQFYKSVFGWLYIFDQTFLFGSVGRYLQRKRGPGGGGSDSDQTADLESEDFTEKIAPMLFSFSCCLVVASIALVLLCFSPISPWAKRVLFALYY